MNPFELCYKNWGLRIVADTTGSDLQSLLNSLQDLRNSMCSGIWHLSFLQSFSSHVCCTSCLCDEVFCRLGRSCRVLSSCREITSTGSSECFRESCKRIDESSRRTTCGGVRVEGGERLFKCRCPDRRGGA